MATRLFTSFMMPGDDVVDEKVRYWIDVAEEYDKVFDQIYPVTPDTSSLQARERFWYTKLEDGKRLAVHPSQILGVEELQVDTR